MNRISRKLKRVFQRILKKEKKQEKKFAHLSKKKRKTWPFAMLLLPTEYICLMLARLEGIDLNIHNLTEEIRFALTTPMKYRWTSWTVPFAFAGAGIWCMMYLRICGKDRNLIPGLEYGSARFGDPEKISRELTDPEHPDYYRILSENLKMSMSSRYTKLNNNVTVIGGSGSGKTFYYVLANALRGQTSMIFTDPKAELYQKLGNVLTLLGYRIATFNLIDMKASDHYNPFAYIHTDNDIIKLVTNIVTNTTPKGASSSDPFWDLAVGMILQAIISYVHYECPKLGIKAAVREVLRLLNLARVTEKEGEKSPLDELMYALPESHPARIAYEKVRSGAKDTIRSIIISAHARLAFLQNPDILRILDEDDINIRSIGEGVFKNPDRKTALFCIIPDNDKSYNFLVGILYSQIFQELYYLADFEYDGSLPVPVDFWLDEFANVPLPDGFVEILSTMRSRNISCNIILQNKSQLQALFKDSHQTILGNCDTLIYLGGNEAESHKYISDMLGKYTVNKKSTGETLGSHGSSSQNFDVLGREILTPDEVRKMDNAKCLVFIRGYDPVLDDKCRTWERDDYLLSQKLGPYKGNGYIDDLYQEGELGFFIDAKGEDGEAASYHAQLERYQGIFAESEAFAQLDTVEGKYLVPKAEYGTYLMKLENGQEEVLPVFDKDGMETIVSGSHTLHKYPVVGYFSEGNVTEDREEAIRVFRQNNRITPLKKIAL